MDCEPLPSTALIRLWASADYPERLRQPRSVDVLVDDIRVSAGGGSISAVPAAATAQDCNKNGVADSCDLAKGTSNDWNRNGLPDECENKVQPVPGIQVIEPQR